MTSIPLTDPRPDRLLRIAILAFAATMAFSIGGMLMLRLVPAAMDWFGPIYPQLIKAPTWTYMALLPVLALLMYGPILGWRRMTFFFAWGSLIGASSELMGTTTGFPFGDYAYTFWLGPKILGHVPYFIPPSWFALSIISLDLAGRIARQRWGRMLLAALFMVCWDVVLDPAMGRRAETTFWYYPDGGFYYGMPLSNWLGWFGVSLIIVAGYEWVGKGLPSLSRWAPRVYLLNGAFPLVLCLLYGLYGAVVAGIAALALPFLLHRLNTPTPSPVVTLAEST